MPVSNAMRKFAKDLPLAAVPVVLAPPDEEVLAFLPPPPHADAINARPTARAAAVSSHLQVCLRFKIVTSRGSIRYRGSRPESGLLRARCILTDVRAQRLVRRSE